jgi:hypothetical protein
MVDSKRQASAVLSPDWPIFPKAHRHHQTDRDIVVLTAEAFQAGTNSIGRLLRHS